MAKVKEYFEHPIIQIALALGFSTIVLNRVSQWLSIEPIGDSAMAIPAFVAAIYGYVSFKYKNYKFSTTWYWIVAIFVATWLVILYHMP